MVVDIYLLIDVRPNLCNPIILNGILGSGEIYEVAVSEFIRIVFLVCSHAKIIFQSFRYDMIH